MYKIEFSFNNYIIHTWCIKHDNQFKKKSLYPVVLEDLFNKRVEFKAQFVSLEKKKEHLRKIISSAKKRDKRVSENLNSEYSFIYFDYNYCNSLWRYI